MTTIDKQPFNIDALEAIIDRHSVADILMAIQAVCHAKADHVASNWQDEELAKRWEDLAEHICQGMHLTKGL